MLIWSPQLLKWRTKVALANERPLRTCERKAFPSGSVIERCHHSQSGRGKGEGGAGQMPRSPVLSPTNATISASWGFCIRGSSGRLPGKSIQMDTEWAKLYKRLVPRLCFYDERMQAYKGKGKALGHIIGRLITLIFALLKKDD